MKKKRPIGLIIIAFLFLMNGINYIFFSPLCFVANKGLKPFVIRGVQSNLLNLEEKLDNITDKSLHTDINNGIFNIKSELLAYEDSSTPMWLKVFTLVSLLISVSFVFTGILLLLLKPLGRTLAFCSSVFGIMFPFLLVIFISFSMKDIFSLGHRLSVMHSRISTNVEIFPDFTIQKFILMIFSEPKFNAFIVTSLFLTLGFAVLVFIYFNRPKVKELFNKV